MKKGSIFIPNNYSVKDGICEISINGEYTAIIDIIDMSMAKSRHWHVMPHGRSYYCRSNKRKIEVGSRVVWLHREIMSAPTGFEVDHVNGNGLDNRRSNLRLCTHAQNMMNQRKKLISSSKYKGVSWRKDRNCWVASIGVKGKNICLGYFDNEIKASMSYTKAANSFFGDYAHKGGMGK